MSRWNTLVSLTNLLDAASKMEHDASKSGTFIYTFLRDGLRDVVREEARYQKEEGSVPVQLLVAERAREERDYKPASMVSFASAEEDDADRYAKWQRFLDMK